MTNRSGLSPDVQHSTPTAVSGALLVDFDSVIGQDRKPFDQTKLGTTVTATVTVRSIDVLAGGHARGIVDGDGGYAIFYIARDYMDRLAHTVTPGATVKVRGVHALVGMLPTISIFAARQVDA
jgi:hypothetical protein